MLDFNTPVHDGTDGAWERPKTTRRYLHPPKAERMFTLWREGKLIFGENTRGVDWRSYAELQSCGMWLVCSAKVAPLDFRRAENILPENGIPIHGLRNSFGGCSIELEAFCNTERKSTCFIRVRVMNRAPYPVRDKVGFLVRSGAERALAHGSPDEYVSYMPDVAEFRHIAKTFTWENGVCRDGDTFITVQSACEIVFEEKQGCIWIPFSLESGESTEAFFSFGRGDVFSFDYEEERAKTVAFWEGELARITELPSAVRSDPAALRLIKNCAVQLLQCYCYHTGKDDLVQRQGGLQRLIWPWEAMPSLEALGRLGDFADYIEPVLSFYFDVQQQPDGEILNIGEGWASVTSSALYSLATYCRRKADKAFWNRYREKALRTFEWIRRKRTESEDSDVTVAGLMPPMRGNDWPQVYQHWTCTDAYAVTALASLADAMEFFGDPSAKEVRAEHRAYQAVIRHVLDGILKQAEGRETYRMPLTPVGDDTFLLAGFHPYLDLAMPFVALEGDFDSADVYRLKAHCVNIGLFKNGLHARMPYANGDTHIWYTSIPDYEWFRVYMMLGDREAARETMEAQIRYSMTDEYYMIERYCDRDPYYVPWSPNASAMGRLLCMMLDYSEN